MKRKAIHCLVVALVSRRALGLSSNRIARIPATASTSRRKLFRSVALLLPLVPASSAPSALAATEEFATSAGRKGCTTVSDPSKTVVVCRGELADVAASEVRLNGIAATENGASTSAIKNPARYAPPWSYLTETSDPGRAWESLKDAVREAARAEIVGEVNGPDNSFYYLHAVAPTVTPPLGNSNDGSGLDDIEFLMRPLDNLVLYRSASRTAVFVYPLTQPVGDGNTNLDRLEKIRSALGWQRLE
jgi:hypothetical protein